MSTSLSEQFRAFSHYNAWANARLYEACGRLAEADYLAPRPAFFGSLHGVLNHILVADRLWLGRIEGREVAIAALDQQLYGEFAGLAVARRAEDARIVALIEGLEEADFAKPLRYRNMAGEDCEDPLGTVLSHVFNHQTHHRGQAHGLLSQTEVPPPSLDMTAFIRETG